MSLTLAPQEVCVGAMEAFKENLPFLKNITADLDIESARYQQNIISRIPSLPPVTEYNEVAGTANQGFKGGGVSDVKGLLSDVPVKLDKWKKVSLSFNYVDNLKATIDITEGMLQVAGSALAKQVASDLVGLVSPANFSLSESCYHNEVKATTLEKIRSTLNGKGALSRRWGIVNSDVASSLLADEKIASADYLHQYSSDINAPYRTIKAGGFTIYEIPWLPNTGNLIGFFADQRALLLASRPPHDFNSGMFDEGQFGFRSIYTDPQTGLSMMIVGYQVAPTLNWEIHLSVLYGVAGGSQGGTAGALLDFSGVRLVDGEATSTVTVKPTLTVIVKNKQVNYGDNAPQYEVTYSGFEEGDSATNLCGSLSFSCSYEAGNAPGSYAITASGLTSSKYNIVYVAGSLTVAKAPLYVAAQNETVTAGESAPEYSATILGFVRSETSSVLGGSLSFACDYTTESDAGEYDITPSGLTSNNYAINYIKGKLTATS